MNARGNVSRIVAAHSYEDGIMNKKDSAAVANLAGLQSRRRGAPVLSEESTREQIVQWLQWNDPNGIHLDELAQKEDVEPYTLESAWAALIEMLRDA